MWEERPLDPLHQEREVPSSRWRFQMEDPHTGRRHGFADLEALLAYLQQVIARTDDSESGLP
jgi:hypothetical protein